MACLFVVVRCVVVSVVVVVLCALLNVFAQLWGIVLVVVCALLQVL